MLRMKGGAVREARSPLKDAIDCRASQSQYGSGRQDCLDVMTQKYCM